MALNKTHIEPWLLQTFTETTSRRICTGGVVEWLERSGECEKDAAICDKHNKWDRVAKEELEHSTEN